MSYEDGINKLSMALHGAVPPLLTVCIAHTLIIDKAFVFFKIMGEAFNSRLKRLFSRLYLLLNTVLFLGICWFVSANCELGEEMLSPRRVARIRFESRGMCLPSVSASCIMALMLMWIDRAAELFFANEQRAPSSIFSRSSTATLVAGAFMASSQNDPSGVFLLALFYTGRNVGSWPTSQAQNFASGLRFAVRIYAFLSGILLLYDARNCELDPYCRATPKTAVLVVVLSVVAS
jgi:hypothetical protein